MKPFRILYIDPPWSFVTRSHKGKGRSPERHYGCMGIKEIMALDLNSIAAKDCMLFLWVTNPMKPFAWKCLEAWGFDYKTTGFTWAKRTKGNKRKPVPVNQRGWHMGNGYYTRQNTEEVWIAVRKGGKGWRVSKNVRQLVDEPVGPHSQKPDCVAERIVQLCGDLPRCELFARRENPGWHCVGNEIDGQDIRTAIAQIAREINPPIVDKHANSCHNRK